MSHLVHRTFQYNDTIASPNSGSNAIGPYDVGHPDTPPQMQLCKTYYPKLDLQPSRATYTFDGQKAKGMSQ